MLKVGPIRKNLLLAAVALIVSGTGLQFAQAQWDFPPNVYSNYVFATQSADLIRKNQKMVLGNNPKQSIGQVGSAPAPRGSTTFRRTASSGDVVAELAQTYPANMQTQAIKTFAELLSKFPQMEQRLGVAPNDVANAVAALIAGSYMAYHDKDFPDADFKPLVTQMQKVLANNKEFKAADDVTRQKTYEQLVIVGLLCAATQMVLQDNPGKLSAPELAAIKTKLRQAGKEYLETFLGVNADRVKLSASGLTLTP